MALITLDFETYYSKEFSLTRLPTEEYIRDARFETIGVAIKVDDQPAKWFTGAREELHKHLLTYDWRNSALLCHNTMFDGAILSWLYGITPAFMFDTLCMARAIHGVDAGGSLKALAERYEIGVKGEEVIAAEGKVKLTLALRSPSDTKATNRTEIGKVDEETWTGWQDENIESVKVPQ